LRPLAPPGGAAAGFTRRPARAGAFFNFLHFGPTFHNPPSKNEPPPMFLR